MVGMAMGRLAGALRIPLRAAFFTALGTDALAWWGLRLSYAYDPPDIRWTPAYASMSVDGWDVWNKRWLQVRRPVFLSPGDLLLCVAGVILCHVLVSGAYAAWCHRAKRRRDDAWEAGLMAAAAMPALLTVLSLHWPDWFNAYLFGEPLTAYWPVSLVVALLLAIYLVYPTPEESGVQSKIPAGSGDFTEEWIREAVEKDLEKVAEYDGDPRKKLEKLRAKERPGVPENVRLEVLARVEKALVERNII